MNDASVSPAEATPHRPCKVVIVDDSSLFRQGVANLLALAGLEVVEQLGTAAPLPAVIAEHHPDVVILDIRMPPTHKDEGIRAAIAVRAQYPQVGVLVLSTYAEGAWARELFEDGSAGLGYLLKDRVDDVKALVEAVARVRDGGTVVDPEVITRLLAATNRRTALDMLSEREHDVLRLMAEGRSNNGIGKALYVSPRTVEAHVAAIFNKLPLEAIDNTSNRRVLAVLTFLHDHPDGRDI